MMNPIDVVINSPIGDIGVLSQGMQINISFLTSRIPLKQQPSKLALKVAQQLETYLLNPHLDFNLPLIIKGTPFQRSVWYAISLIPSGKTITYAELAAQVGSGPRAVANACGANHMPIIIPCHRVVAKNGIGGYMANADGGLKIKKWLLAHEGVVIVDSKINQHNHV